MNKKTLFLVLLAGFLVLPTLTLAASNIPGLTSFCDGNSNVGCVNNLTSLVGSIELAIAYLFGAIVVVCFVVAGILFMTANGAPDKLNTARSALLWGVVGVAVGIIAYSIVMIVSNMLGA